MNSKSFEQLKELIISYFEEINKKEYIGLWDFSVEIVNFDNYFNIILSKMYNYVPINFDFLKLMADYCNTDDISETGKDHYNGCETCDWGSKYSISFTIKNSDLIK